MSKKKKSDYYTNSLNEKFINKLELLYCANAETKVINKTNISTIGELLERNDIDVFRTLNGCYTFIMTQCKEYKAFQSQINNLCLETSKYKQFFDNVTYSEHKGLLSINAHNKRKYENAIKNITIYE